jgi:hypothetical protein
MAETRNAWEVSVRKPQWKKPLQKRRCRWEERRRLK